MASGIGWGTSMSLFENDWYRYRDTYFILFDEANRPTAAAIQEVLESLGDRFEIREVRADANAAFESLTLLSPIDYAGMDITYTSGEDVVLHVDELSKEMVKSGVTKDDKEKLKRIKGYTARFEIFHFEQIAESQYDDEDEILDPGGLLIVMDRLTEFCQGVAIDPQAGAFM